MSTVTQVTEFARLREKSTVSTREWNEPEHFVEDRRKITVKSSKKINKGAQGYAGESISNPWELLDVIAINTQLSTLEFLWTCVDVYIPFVKGYSDRWRGQMKSTFEVHVSPYYLLGSLEVSIISYKPTLRNNWVSKDTEGLTKKETKDTGGLMIHIEYRIGIFSIPILKQSRSKQSKANQGKAKQTKQSKAK